MRSCISAFCSMLLLLLLVSCASDRPIGTTEAEVLFKEAEKLMADSKFLLATEKLNLIRSKHPFSYYATHAELLQADILFNQENYVESASAYILFRDFHPKHKKASYVIWRIAESFYNQLPDTIDRDLSSSDEAIRYYEEIVQKYPKSEYVKVAGAKIVNCKEMQTDKERYIADFYFKTEVFDAARYRYLSIAKNRQHNAIRGHSVIRVLEASLELKDYQGCIGYSKELSTGITAQQQARVTEIQEECQAKIKEGA